MEWKAACFSEISSRSARFARGGMWISFAAQPSTRRLQQWFGTAGFGSTPTSCTRTCRQASGSRSSMRRGSPLQLNNPCRHGRGWGCCSFNSCWRFGRGKKKKKRAKKKKAVKRKAAKKKAAKKKPAKKKSAKKAAKRPAKKKKAKPAATAAAPAAALGVSAPSTAATPGARTALNPAAALPVATGSRPEVGNE